MADDSFRVKNGLEVAGTARIDNDLWVLGEASAQNIVLSKAESRFLSIDPGTAIAPVAVIETFQQELLISGDENNVRIVPGLTVEKLYGGGGSITCEGSAIILGKVGGYPEYANIIAWNNGNSREIRFTGGEVNARWEFTNDGETYHPLAESTDDLTEGSTNLYYTDARVDANFATKDTGDLTEGTNLYYTDVRARGAVSVSDTGGDGALSYDSGTGVITYTGPSASEVRAHFSGGTGVTYTAGTGVIEIGQNVATSASPSFVGGTFTGNITTAGAGGNRFTRSAAGTGNTIPLILNRNRTDGARANANGPWLAFEYQGTDNTLANSPIAAVRSQYDTSGRNYLELLELAGSYSSGVQPIARFKRGDYFFKNTTGGNCFTVDDDNCSITGQVATAGFQNLLFLIKRRTDVTAPTDGDLADFRIGFQGNTGSAITVGKFEGEYNATTGHKFTMNVANSTGTTTIPTVSTTQKETTINAIPTSGIGAPAEVATFNRDNIILGGTTGTLPGGDLLYRRTHGCFHKVANVTAAAANTVYNFDWYTDTNVHVGNQGVTVTSGQPTRVNIDTAGAYTAFLEMQIKNTNNSERNAWIWLAKNGTDIAETRIKLVLRATAGTDAYQFVTKLWCLDNIADNDYIELRFAVSNTSGISLEYEAAQVSPFAMPAQPSVTFTITPVGA